MQQEIRQKLIDLNDSRVNAILGVTVFEVGKWYKATDSKFMVLLTEFNEVYDSKGYYFDTDGEWRGFDAVGLYDCSEATREEVKQRLIEEATRRGFVDGVHINNSSLGYYYNEVMDDGDNFSYNRTRLSIGEYGITIFKDGVWAEIKEQL